MQLFCIYPTEWEEEKQRIDGFPNSWISGFFWFITHYSMAGNNTCKIPWRKEVNERN
jgi:hypothetical protein